MCQSDSDALSLKLKSSLLLPSLATANLPSQPDVKAFSVGGVPMGTGDNLTGIDLSRSGPFVARFPGSPKRFGLEIKSPSFCRTKMLQPRQEARTELTSQGVQEDGSILPFLYPC